MTIQVETNACSGTVTLTAGPNDGMIEDGYGRYYNDLFCGWIIENQPGHIFAIALEITYLNTKLEDFLNVYDGSNSTAPLLGKFSGDHGYTSIIMTSSTSGIIYIEFITDSNDNSMGFGARYWVRSD